jgi:exosortase/archaeosortase family protein
MSDSFAANTTAQVRKRVVSQLGPIERGRLFAGLALIGFANGISHRVVQALRDDPARATLQGFEIGAVVWIALFTSAHMLGRQQGQAASRNDMLAAGLASAAFLAPVPPLSWLALSGLGIYVALTSPTGSASRRGAWILVALTVPMFWSRILFLLMSDAILRFDAFFVGLILGTGRSGNAIAFADGWGYFWIAPPCSSLANISLALLCWVVVTQALGRPNAALRYCLLAVLSVIVINVMRLALTGISHANYNLLHGATGNLILGWLTFAVTLAICLYGATREASHAAAASD